MTPCKIWFDGKSDKYLTSFWYISLYVYMRLYIIDCSCIFILLMISIYSEKWMALSFKERQLISSFSGFFQRSERLKCIMEASIWFMSLKLKHSLQNISPSLFSCIFSFGNVERMNFSRLIFMVLGNIYAWLWYERKLIFILFYLIYFL